MHNICKLLGTKYPVIQGGMANIATAQLAAAVSNAGGLGLIGAGGNDAQWVKNEIHKYRELTDKPFGVNIMLMSPHAPEIAQLLIDENVKVVTTGAGNPVPYMAAWKNAGMIVIPVIPTAKLAIRVANNGADAVVAEGMEAGGHIGKLTTMAMIPQIADAVSIPVIAAGGIADKRGVLAAFALGAKGVQIGTVLLATNECPIHDNFKKLVIEATDTSTVVTGSEKAPVRVIHNIMAKKYIYLIKSGASFETLEHLTLGSLKKAVVEGDIENGSFMAGQIAGLVNEIKSVQSVLENMFDDVISYKDSLTILY
jgi:enoyl-[acyl-carrier protein] reductase II